MTKLAKEGDVVDGGSMTRLATEPYVDEHAGSGAPPPIVPVWSDDFSVDNRANYTFPNGLNMAGGGSSRASVSGGQLHMAATDGLWSLLYPTAVTPKDEYVAKIKLNIASTGGDVYTGVCAKVLDGNNYCGVEVDTQGAAMKPFFTSAGSYNAGTGNGTLPRGVPLWLVTGVRGNFVYGTLYSEDPELVPDANVLGNVGMTIPSGLADGHPGIPGILLAGQNPASPNTPVDDFKIWEADEQLVFNKNALPPTDSPIGVYTVATIPSAEGVQDNTIIYVSDAPAGDKFAISQGDVWKRVTGGTFDTFGGNHPFVEAVLDLPNLLGYWRLNDTDAVIRDAAALRANGSWNGAIPAVAGSLLGESLVSGARDLENSATAWGDIGNISLKTSDTNGWTFGCIVNIESGADGGVFATGDASSGGSRFMMGVGSDLNPFMGNYGTANFGSGSPASLSVNNKVLLIFTENNLASAAKIFIAGSEYANATQPPLNVGPVHGIIGALTLAGGQTFDGIMGECFLVNRVLTDLEISNLEKQFKGSVYLSDFSDAWASTYATDWDQYFGGAGSISGGSLRTGAPNSVVYHKTARTDFKFRIKHNSLVAPGFVRPGVSGIFGPNGSAVKLYRVHDTSAFDEITTLSLSAANYARGEWEEIEKIGNVVKLRTLRADKSVRSEATYTLTGTDASDLSTNIHPAVWNLNNGTNETVNDAEIITL